MNNHFFKNALVLGLLSAIGPFAIDMYLPALPSIGQSLNAPMPAVQASLMALLDRRLHRPQEDMSQRTIVGRVLDAQPPLLEQERLLFRLIWVGFVVLTLAVFSGSYTSMMLTGKVLPFDHKTVFTLLSWLTFGILLLGRHIWGWRGRVALRWTLTGFALLILAYTGSRFVLEVILHRS